MSLNERSMHLPRLAHRVRELLRGLRDYFGSAGRRRRDEPVNDAASLRRFLETRASYVAQTSLYGYLRTRAGMNYPQLFEEDEFVRAVNIAKWHMWLACLSDLSIYAGGLLVRRAPARAAEAATLVREQVGAILENAGVPAEAGTQFAAHAAEVRQRLATCDWQALDDDENAFTASPAALVRWAPVVDTLKDLDEEIVRNSVRFRWQEVRRALRDNLDPDALLRSGR